MWAHGYRAWVPLGGNRRAVWGSVTAVTRCGSRCGCALTLALAPDHQGVLRAAHGTADPLVAAEFSSAEGRLVIVAAVVGYA